MSMEMNKALDLLREIRPSIPKEVLELWCKDRDAFLASHPAVEQAGGDERDLQGAQGERDGWGPFPIVQVPWNVFDRAVMWVEDRRRYGDDGTIVDDWKALKTIQRAALAQPSPVQAEGFPELLESVRQMDAMLKAKSVQADCIYCQGSKVVSTTDTDHNGDHIEMACPKCTEQAEAEAERPEVVARVVHSNPVVLDHCGPLNANDELMTVAQHAASVARWAEMFNRVEQERDAALAEVERLIGVCASLDSEKRDIEHKRDATLAMRDAALARVAELESKLAELEMQAPVAFLYRGTDMGDQLTLIRLDHYWRPKYSTEEHDYIKGIPLYAAPVAQAQQLHDLDKQCRDDVARALGLRPSQGRGFAWSYLLASIKSCVKASEDTDQAQHSVPELLVRAEGFVSGFEDDDEQEGVSQLLADLRLAIGRVK